MKRKIIGATVGSPLPKPNLMQNDPKKGDYVKGKEEFLEQIATPDPGGNTGTGVTAEQVEQIDKNAKAIAALQRGVTMTDRTTSKKYVVYIDNGKLTMAESEG